MLAACHLAEALGRKRGNQPSTAGLPRFVRPPEAQMNCNAYALSTRFALLTNAPELHRAAGSGRNSAMSTATPARHENAVTDAGDPAALLARTQNLSRRLHEREEFYRSVLESLREGVLITDRENRVLYANSRVECLTGYSRTELI